MRHHSLFFSGGDIEIGKLASMLRYRVGHIPFIFYTDVPETFRAWFKQRRAWFGGGFRHVVLNMNQHLWKHPLHFVYFTILVYLLYPLRVYELIRYPWILPILVLIYWTLIMLFHWRSWKWYYLLFPFYALFQVMVIVPCGVARYIHMAYYSRNTGFIRMRDRDHRRSRLKTHHYLFNVIGGGIAALLCLTLVLGYTYLRFRYEKYSPVREFSHKASRLIHR